MGDFKNQKLTHIGATHAFSKIREIFQNRIPRELNQKFYIPRVSMIHWIFSNFLEQKTRPYKKVMPILNPGIRPIDNRRQVVYLGDIWLTYNFFSCNTLLWYTLYSLMYAVFSNVIIWFGFSYQFLGEIVEDENDAHYLN